MPLDRVFLLSDSSWNTIFQWHTLYIFPQIDYEFLLGRSSKIFTSIQSMLVKASAWQNMLSNCRKKKRMGEEVRHTRRDCHQVQLLEGESFIPFYSPFPLEKANKEVRNCALDFAAAHTALRQRLIIDFIDGTNIIYSSLSSEHMLDDTSTIFFYSENMTIVLTHRQENYIYQVINLGCQ